MVLRLVGPPPGAHPARPSRGRRSPALSLTAEEERHLRITIRNTARAYGGFPVLASVLSISPASLRSAASDKGRHLSGTLAIRVAKAAGMRVEAVIGPALSEAGRCSTCGARVGERRAS